MLKELKFEAHAQKGAEASVGLQTEHKRPGIVDDQVATVIDMLMV